MPLKGDDLRSAISAGALDGKIAHTRQIEITRDADRGVTRVDIV